VRHRFRRIEIDLQRVDAEVALLLFLAVATDAVLVEEGLDDLVEIGGGGGGRRRRGREGNSHEQSAEGERRNTGFQPVRAAGFQPAGYGPPAAGHQPIEQAGSPLAAQAGSLCYAASLRDGCGLRHGCAE
jgi:hypothetical protein